jgi:hypothetical protein
MKNGATAPVAATDPKTARQIPRRRSGPINLFFKQQIYLPFFARYPY